VPAAASGPAPIALVVASDAPAPHWHLAPELSAPARAEAVAAAPGPAPAAPQTVVGQVATAVARATDGQVEIRLDPPELGRVQILLQPADGGVQAVVLAQRPETQDLLRRHAELLAQELGAAGFGSVSLDFGGGEPAPNRDDAPAAWHAPAFAAAPAEVPPARPSRPVAGGLDIRL
jgi:hypothetical protein